MDLCSLQAFTLTKDRRTHEVGYKKGEWRNPSGAAVPHLEVGSILELQFGDPFLSTRDPVRHLGIFPSPREPFQLNPQLGLILLGDRVNALIDRGGTKA